jgi:hypothetical protein
MRTIASWRIRKKERLEAINKRVNIIEHSVTFISFHTVSISVSYVTEKTDFTTL